MEVIEGVQEQPENETETENGTEEETTEVASIDN
jgi:hypothetical protein